MIQRHSTPLLMLAMVVATISCSDADDEKAPPTSSDAVLADMPGEESGDTLPGDMPTQDTVDEIALAGETTTPDGAATDDVSPPLPADLALPPYPFWETDAVLVDEPHLAEVAGSYCATDEAPSAAGFLLGSMPLGAMDTLGRSALTRDEATVLFGDLYLSGYFGGVWLRDSLEDPATLPTEAPTYTEAPDLLFIMIDSEATRKLDLAFGPDEGLVAAMGSELSMLLYLYGYNRGYVEVVLEHPPAGMTAPDDVMVCSDLIVDCTSPTTTLPVLETWRAAALPSLVDPPNDAWAALAAMIAEEGPANVQKGRETWEEILGEEEISADRYLLLLDLSVAYLLTAEASLLSAMSAKGNDDTDAARVAALLSAGLMTWSQSYFMGLTSAEAYDTFPSLACPD